MLTLVIAVVAGWMLGDLVHATVSAIVVKVKDLILKIKAVKDAVIVKLNSVV